MRFSPAAPPRWDGVLAVGLVVVFEMPGFNPYRHGSGFWWAAVAVPGIAALAWRRVRPGPVWAVSTGVAMWLLAMRDGHDWGALSPLMMLVAPLIALTTLAARAPRWQGAAALALSVAGLESALLWDGHRPESLPLAAVLAVAAWAVGDGARARRAYGAAREERAAADERTRIARELHDIIAHHISVVALQAGTARLLAELGRPVDAALLGGLETASRQAMSELRHTLGVLRHSPDGGGPPAGPRPAAGSARQARPCRALGVGDGGTGPAAGRRRSRGVPGGAGRVDQRAQAFAGAQRGRHAQARRRCAHGVRPGRRAGPVRRPLRRPRRPRPGRPARTRLGVRWLAAGRPPPQRRLRTTGPSAARGVPVTIRVLLADDQPLVRVGLRALLGTQPDLEVVGEAADGAAAAAQARALTPDVVLMDVRMPGTDGIAATRRITGTGDGRVLILTTYDLDEYVYDVLTAGASGFLLKDARPEDLIGGIRLIAAGEALLAPSVTRRLISTFAQRPSPSPARHPAALEALTGREREVLDLVVRGQSNAEIGATMRISGNTVKAHLHHVLEKLGVRDRVHAVIFAYEHGLVHERPARAEAPQ